MIDSSSIKQASAYWFRETPKTKDENRHKQHSKRPGKFDRQGATTRETGYDEFPTSLSSLLKWSRHLWSAKVMTKAIESKKKRKIRWFGRSRAPERPREMHKLDDVQTHEQITGGHLTVCSIPVFPVRSEDTGERESTSCR